MIFTEWCELKMRGTKYISIVMYADPDDTSQAPMQDTQDLNKELCSI